MRRRRRKVSIFTHLFTALSIFPIGVKHNHHYHQVDHEKVTSKGKATKCYLVTWSSIQRNVPCDVQLDEKKDDEGENKKAFPKFNDNPREKLKPEKCI